MTSGVFGGLLFCNLVFPAAITDEAKILCGCGLGVGLWYVALHGERVVLQIFAGSAGMATGTLIFNVVAEFYVINAHFLILALAAVRGWLLNSMCMTIKKKSKKVPSDRKNTAACTVCHAIRSWSRPVDPYRQGCVMGYMLAGHMQNGAFVMMYAATGGFLVRGASEWTFFCTSVTHL